MTYLTNTLTPQLPAIQVSTLPAKRTIGQDILKKVVMDFIACWGVQTEAFGQIKCVPAKMRPPETLTNADFKVLYRTNILFFDNISVFSKKNL